MEVKDFPNYLIYPDGRVFSKNGRSNGFMKPDTNGGYYYVYLYKDGKSKLKKIHRLIAEHYIPNPDNKPFVDHKNRDRKDNRIENLRWVTRRENNINRTIGSNNTIGFKWISPMKSKNGNKEYHYLRFVRKHYDCKNKYSKDLSKLLCYSFFYLLKYPIDT
jgi:hypothetical protein